MTDVNLDRHFAQARKHILELCEHYNGEKEKNNNDNIFGEWFGLNKVPWCGIMVSFIYHKAGVLEWLKYKKIEGGKKPVGFYHEGFAYVPTAYDYWLKQGLKTHNPKGGDVVIFDWNMDGYQEHTGIFIKWIDRQKGIFQSFEGNTSADDRGSQSNGDGAYYKQRNTKHVAGFFNLMQ